MSLMPSLCAALERAGGQRLVMRAGDRPHVLAADRRHDVASAVLSLNAVEALVDQILSADSRRTLSERGSVEETLNTPSFPHPLTARAEHIGDDFCVELIVTTEPEPVPASEPVDTPIILAVSEDVPFDSEISTVDAIDLLLPSDAVEEPEPEPVAAAPVEPLAPVVAPEPVALRSMDPPPHVRDFAARTPLPPLAGDPAPPVLVVARMEDARVLARSTMSTQLDLHGFISYAYERGATTLFLRAGAAAAARINDRIVSLSEGIVPAAVFEEIAAFTGRDGDGVWRTVSDGEWARDHDDFGHATCRLFSDDQGHGLVVQLRPRLSPKSLHKYIPREVRAACESDGLIVVAAESDADAESLASAVADWSGRTRGGYVISLHRRSHRAELSGAFVSQRAISGSESDFASAIRRASHEGPDTLVVAGPQSEIVQHEAILAAATGRLVIVAVVAPTAVQALRATLGHSGLDRDAHVRRALASSLRVAIAYRSLRRLGGGRMLVQDIITASKDSRVMIEAGDFDGLTLAMHQGASGTRSVDNALARAARRGQISLREAAAHADDRQRLIALVRQRAHDHLNVRRKADHEVHVPISIEDRPALRARY